MWIDEIPQMINLIRGDIKLVGVRPLSEAMYKQYPEDLKEARIKMKPGLIPPYYYDLPKSIEEVYESEWRYLKRYKRHPMVTDFEYFIQAVWNIIMKRARSS